jgi:proline-specific peptidase
VPESSGFVPGLEYRLFYRSFGPEQGTPTILGLHGGPGASHDYLLPLADLARDGFRVVLFDQLGCGRSEVPDDVTHYTLDHHVLETEQVRQGLGLGRVHLVGSSYGGLLAIAVALAHPATLRSLTTVGGLASVPFASAEMDRLRGGLPAEVRAVLDRCEADGTTSRPEYAAAAMVFYRQFVCRLDPWPAELTRSLELAATHPVYPYMNGPSEFTITGTIRDIDLSGDLPRIRAPTLVLGGRYDEVTPRVAAQIRDGIPGARGLTFLESSHMPFWEERDRFTEVVGDFLSGVDRRPQ